MTRQLPCGHWPSDGACDDRCADVVLEWDGVDVEYQRSGYETVRADARALLRQRRDVIYRRGRKAYAAEVMEQRAALSRMRAALRRAMAPVAQRRAA